MSVEEALRRSHTPGPWKIVPKEPFAEDEGGSVAIRTLAISGSRWLEFALVYLHVEGKSEGEANARLIAAAPDLLEALRACEANLRLIHEAAGPVPKGAPLPEPTFKVWQNATAAIAKATGGIP